VDLRASLYDLEKRKFLTPPGLDPSVVQPVASLYTDYAIPARVDNIKMDLREIGCDSVDWTHMAQDREQWRVLVSTVLNLRVP
jgi:hypothetical protein